MMTNLEQTVVPFNAVPRRDVWEGGRPPQGIVCLVLLGVFLIFGCGGRDDGPPKANVTGTVTWQGQPVKEGQIQFVPIDAAGGPVTGALIQDGVYEATGRGAVPVGKHTVKILATEDDPGAQVDGMPVPPKKQLLPERFNTRSELTIEVPAGTQFTHDFNLE